MSPWAAAALEHIQHVAKTPEELRMAARFVIQSVEHRKPQQSEVMELATALGQHTAMFATWLGGRNLDGERGGMLEMDAIAVDYLTALGEPGQAEATQVAAEARTRWEKAGEGNTPGFLWSAWYRDREAGVARFVVRLARLLWTGWAEPGLVDQAEPEATIANADPGSAGAGTSVEEKAPATPVPSVSLPVLDAVCEQFLGKQPFHGSERSLDRERGTLLIRQGKGKKDRIIPIGERAMAWVEKYVHEVRPKLAMEPDEGVLFLTAEGEAVTPGHLTDQVSAYIEAAGIGKKGSCHPFRHTMATLMLEGGADIRFIQAMLGHESLTSTQLYTRVSIRKLKEIHTATHPAARLARKGGGQDEDEPDPEAERAEVLAQLDEEADEDGG